MIFLNLYTRPFDGQIKEFLKFRLDKSLTRTVRGAIKFEHEITRQPLTSGIRRTVGTNVFVCFTHRHNSNGPREKKENVG